MIYVKLIELIHLNANIPKDSHTPERINMALEGGKYIKSKSEVIITIKKSDISLEDSVFSQNTIIMELDTQFETQN